ncbi:MAG: lectin-like protein [Candidatus Zixiibacteriota bacterium]
MFNQRPAGPATKSKNRRSFLAIAGVMACLLLGVKPGHAQVIEHPITGHKYEYVRLRGFITWPQANLEAVARGGYLATVTDTIEARIVSALLAHPGEKVFLGATDHNDSCTWQWLTGEPWIFENWAPGKPSGEEPCVNSLRTSYERGGQWEADVGPLDGFIVEWNAEPTDTLLHLVQWPASEGGNGHWYAYLPNPMPWDQARLAAGQFEMNGVPGHLASITSQQENDFVFWSIIMNGSNGWEGHLGHHWLGGYNDTIWTWVTGEPMVYTNWAVNEPSDSGANPVVAMVGPPWLECAICPQPSEWVAHERNTALGSIVEFDTQPVEPRTLFVPEEYPTIQSAIDAATHGDRVLVGPGTYVESINFLGKNITVRGADGPLTTTITNERTVDLVTFNHGETRGAVLEGFTLRGGWIAVLCVNSAPTIRRNVCVDQNVTNWAAICLSGPIDSLVDPNGDPRYHPTFGDAPALLLNNTIVSSANGGVSSFSVAPPTAKNNIIAFNGHYGFHHQGGFALAQPDLSYNDVFGNPDADYYNIVDPGPGSFSLDPTFNAEYTLGAGSPCIDAGDPNPRFNDPDGTRNDMGAMPFIGGQGGVIPTNEWVVAYCHGFNPPIITDPGSVSILQAFDPTGVLCGQTLVWLDGGFLMPVYRDDPYTNVDEGCVPGDLIQFKINGESAQPSPPVFWTANGDVFEVCNLGVSHCVNIPLHEGWNLVSWNVAFESEIRLALDEIIGCVEVVHSYEQGGLVFDPNLDLFNTLTHVDYHHGYWIRMRCDAMLQVCGDQIPFAEFIALEPGWNLVSYWPEWPLPVETGFYSIMEQLQEAMGFDNGAQIWLPDLWQFNTLTELRPTFGYWAKVSEPAALSYPRWFEPWDTIWWPPDSGYTETPPLSETSRSWMSVYGDYITVDVRPVENGAMISFRTGDNITCGRGVYQDNTLRMTPVYGLDGSGDVSKLYPKEGDRIAVYVDDTRVYPDLIWVGSGERVRLSRLTEDPAGLPQTYTLDQNYPNPFNPGTTIAFEVAADVRVNLSIYNVLGQKVRTLTDQHYLIGRYALDWNGKDDNGIQVSTGVYFYRLTAGETVLTKKMMLLK